MKFARMGEPGHERPVVVVPDGHLDASSVCRDIDSAFWSQLPAIRDAVTAGDLPPAQLPADVRTGAPITRPGKIICIGLNYLDHAAETGADIPAEPVIFMKAPNCVVGPNDDVQIPRGSTHTDWEVELGIVIGRTARYLESREDALDCIGGYVLSHDVSEREYQLERGGTWDKGKSCETFNPLGPWLVTADEVPDPQALAMRLWVNDVARQQGNTSSMIFDVAEIVRYVSQFMVLEPGDLINTGTPAGVALGLPDKPYLRAGDVVRLEIDGLGAQRQVLAGAR
jgi:2-keto-4-pentenoate hydratase/2-oxohepta-3-ene-1,7-dioic acid hydratase in catechol pathway